ncbi:ferritin family protein [Desulfopila inferna]|uniref:ferritin family protein n=1 Tax=Desulfopila inferna TaxID=468528 RepID=UPI0019628160|nr:ferritin family protein [Desulfopila inferna]MBM9604079.1 ferritin family protein [Desulfopila inferna]
MFTIADIRHIAIQIERNGEETYRKAAAAAEDPEIAAMLVRMADDEKEHAQWFERINANKKLTAEQREMEAVGKTILQEMVRNRTFSLDQNDLRSVSSLEEILSTSQGFEQDTILFYEMLAGFIEDDETRQQLQSVISEEHKHFEELQTLLKKASADK